MHKIKITALNDPLDRLFDLVIGLITLAFIFGFWIIGYGGIF